jgi:hypothetical protein
MDMTAVPSSSSPRGVEPPLKKARPWSFLRVSSRYVHEVFCCLYGFCLSCFYP